MIIMSAIIAVVVIAMVGLILFLSPANVRPSDNYLIEEAEFRGIAVLVHMTPVQASGRCLANMISFIQACTNANIKHPPIQLKRCSDHPPAVKVFAEWGGANKQIGHLLPELATRLMMFDDVTPLYGAVAYLSVRNNQPIIRIHVGVPSNPTYRPQPDDFDVLDYIGHLVDEEKKANG